jgi:hypothetical protein
VRTVIGAHLSRRGVDQDPSEAGSGQRATDTNDYPAGTAAYATRSFTNIVERAHKVANTWANYADRLFDRQLPWTMMRQGYQLLRLCDTYGAAKVDAVCERSLSFDVVDVPRIARMLRMAMSAEAEAEERGKLRKLPQTPRFARDAGTYSTVETKREEDR